MLEHINIQASIKLQLSLLRSNVILIVICDIQARAILFKHDECYYTLSSDIGSFTKVGGQGQELFYK